jgi:hypothetical protein
MRIAFDLDGVLADLHRTFVATALQLFPELDASALSSPDAGASPPTGIPGSEIPAEPDESSLKRPLSPRKGRQSGGTWPPWQLLGNPV